MKYCSSTPGILAVAEQSADMYWFVIARVWKCPRTWGVARNRVVVLAELRDLFRRRDASNQFGVLSARSVSGIREFFPLCASLQCIKL